MVVVESTVAVEWDAMAGLLATEREAPQPSSHAEDLPRRP